MQTAEANGISKTGFIHFRTHSQEEKADTYKQLQ